jgi:hypothetical protein
VFAEFFSELDGGGASKAEILGDGPLFRASRSHLASRSIMMRQRAAAISQCRCTHLHQHALQSGTPLQQIL